MTPIAASDPRSPSKLPPFGTESMCDPNRIGGSDGVGAGAAREDVAGRIDARLELRRAHQVHDVPSAGDIGVRVGDAADAVRERPARRAAEHAQGLDARPERGGVDDDRLSLAAAPGGSPAPRQLRRRWPSVRGMSAG